MAVIVVITALFISVKVNYPIKYTSCVNKYTSEYKLDKTLVYAIIKCESSFNKNATSKVGAMGLMQIMPTTAKFIAEQLQEEKYDMYNAEQNIKFGCFYLNYLLSKFNNIKMVIYAYNCGEGRVNRYLKGENLPKETINYYKKVMGAKRTYKILL